MLLLFSSYELQDVAISFLWCKVEISCTEIVGFYGKAITFGPQYLFLCFLLLHLNNKWWVSLLWKNSFSNWQKEKRHFSCGSVNRSSIFLGGCLCAFNLAFSTFVLLILLWLRKYTELSDVLIFSFF